jgi:hypothetical protein
MESHSEHALSLARDILGGEARAAWSADWPQIMAAGILELDANGEGIFDAAGYDLPIPKDRYGRKADKLVVALGSIELDRTSEEDLEVFRRLTKGEPVEITLRGFVTQAAEVSKANEDGEDDVEMRRTIKVMSITSAQAITTHVASVSVEAVS